MEILTDIYSTLKPVVPSVEALIATLVVLIIVRIILNRKYKGALELKFRRQIITLLILFVGMLAIILVLPMSDSKRGQLLSLIGILLSAAIALSSTTILGNLIAGFMLRAIRHFKAGDFIRVGDYFGRVSDRGLFHIEVQTEDRDLTTFPNMYLVTNPVTVSRSTGTIISSTVSLGYDVPRKNVQNILLSAAEDAKLEEPFVHVMELGDFSVTYRIAGLLKEVKQLISARSKLRELMLDKLHESGIEIVSPTFMNQRQLKPERVFIPESVDQKSEPEPAYTDLPEDVVFDKAEEAESTEKLKERHDKLGEELSALKETLGDADGDEKENIKSRISNIEDRRERLADIIERRRQEKE